MIYAAWKSGGQVHPANRRPEGVSVRVDFRAHREHEERMRLPLLLLIPGLLVAGGCSLLPHRGESTTPPPPQATAPAAKPAPKRGFFETLLHPFSGKHRTPQKKAQPLRQVGTVRTLANDGSYVIVELEPGMTVAPGTELLITATGGRPARLKVGEIQAPYFVADIVEGNPEPGDRVQQ